MKIIDGLGASAGIVISLLKIRFPFPAVHAIRNTSCSVSRSTLLTVV
ncbi:MAG TPA: hypothetical protein VFK40_09975 [Nitrososphaeraceae archaeon]|nr:hypothetical protein [Nitrososphaeraceae archaeon]HET8792320.1 hypothetical protein [Nitrososphaeraceae archaeon]